MDNKEDVKINISVKLGKLKKVVDFAEKVNSDEDAEIPFEYIVGSCFPDVYKNIQTVIRAQYTEGYLQGLNERKQKYEKESFKFTS